MGNCECRMRIPCSRKTWCFKSNLESEDDVQGRAFGRLVPPVPLPQADIPGGPVPPVHPLQPMADPPVHVPRRVYANVHVRPDDICRLCGQKGHWVDNCPLGVNGPPVPRIGVERRKNPVPSSVVVTATGACFHHKGCEHVLGRRVTKLRRCEICKEDLKHNSQDA